MENYMQLVWLAICVVIAFVVLKKITKVVFKIIILAILIGLFFAGSKAIDLSVVVPDLMEKFESVTEVVGDNLVKMEDNSVLVKVQDEWYDVSKVAIIGDLATEDVILEYDGKELYVGHTGVVNVLKTLNQFGLLEVRD